MSFKYYYKGVTYDSEQAVRDAIWDKERKIFGSPNSEKEWETLGVSFKAIVEDVELVRNPDLNELKLIKRSDLKVAFDSYRASSETYIVSSLGFKVNANVSALENVNGLVKVLDYRKESEEMPVVNFKDFEGVIHKLNAEQMALIQYELITNNSNAYEQKWLFASLVEQANDKAELDAINFVFHSATF